MSKNAKLAFSWRKIEIFLIQRVHAGLYDVVRTTVKPLRVVL